MHRNPLRWITPLVLLITLGLGIWVRWDIRPEPLLRLRQQIGLPRGLDQPGLAVQLARTQGELDLIFGSDDPTIRRELQKDVGREMVAVRRDYFFIPAYTLLLILFGLRTWIPGAPHSSPVRCLLVLLPPIAALLDVLENLGLIAALKATESGANAPAFWFSICSWLKWLILFGNLLLLGWSQLRIGDIHPVGTFWRELGGLMLCLGGGIGLLSVGWATYIPPALGIGASGLLCLGMMGFYPDFWWQETFRWKDLSWKSPTEV